MRNLMLSLCLVSGLTLLGQPAAGAFLSTSKSGLLDGLEVRNGDVISATANVGASGLWLAEEDIFGLGLDGLPQNVDVDAVALLADGRIVVSIDEGQVATVDGVTIGSGDLLAYDPSDGSAAILLAGADLGVGNIDAAHVFDDGRMLLSFSKPEMVGGVNVKDGDVYEYDPATGTGSIFLYEEEVFATPELDVNAVSMIEGRVLLGTREDAVFTGGYVLPAAHVAIYDPATGEASTYLTLEGRILDPTIDAVAFVPECGDGIDNDADGLVDAPGDMGCVTEAADLEAPACQDGIDNNGNGAIDFDGGLSVLGEGHPDLTEPDAGCSGLAWARDETATSCGLGFEAALLLLPLMWLHTSRRRRAAVLASE